MLQQLCAIIEKLPHLSSIYSRNCANIFVIVLLFQKGLYVVCGAFVLQGMHGIVAMLTVQMLVWIYRVVQKK